MSTELTTYSEQTFESIKHINEAGQEYWLARELQPVLDYAQWRNFNEAIERAKLACKNSGFERQTILLTSAKWSSLGLGRNAKSMIICSLVMRVI